MLAARFTILWDRWGSLPRPVVSPLDQTPEGEGKGEGLSIGDGALSTGAGAGSTSRSSRAWPERRRQ